MNNNGMSQLFWLTTGAIALGALWFLFLRPASEGLRGLGIIPKKTRRRNNRKRKRTKR